VILRWQTGSTKLGSLFLTLPTRVLTGRGRRHHHHRRAVEAGRGIVASLPPTANEWFDHTLYNRLSGKQLGSIVLIMHRLHEDDLTGHALAQEDWEIVRLPAIAEADERVVVDTPLGPFCFERRRGEEPSTFRSPFPP